MHSHLYFSETVNQQLKNNNYLIVNNRLLRCSVFLPYLPDLESGEMCED